MWWNRGGGTEDIDGKPMALFVNFIPNMVSQIEGRHFAWKPKIVSKLEYPYGDCSLNVSLLIHDQSLVAELHKEGFLLCSLIIMQKLYLL